MSGNWLDASSTSNRYIQTYMRGFLDMSGGNLLLRNNNIIVQAGDISLNGRLFVVKDVSINGNLYAKGNILMDASSFTDIRGAMLVENNVNVTGIINQSSTLNLSGGYVYVPTTSTQLTNLIQYVNYGVGQLYSSVGSGVLVLGNTSLVGYTTTTVVLGDLQTYGNAYFSGSGTFSTPNMKTINFGSATLGVGSIMASGNVTVTGNMIANGISMGYSTLPTYTSSQIGYINNVAATTGSFSTSPSTILSPTSLTGIYILNGTINVTPSVAGNVTLTLSATTTGTINGSSSSSFTSYIGAGTTVTLPISCNLYMPSGASISGTFKTYSGTATVTASNFSFIRIA